jgi:hypothetical protein
VARRSMVVGGGRFSAGPARRRRPESVGVRASPQGSFVSNPERDPRRYNMAGSAAPRWAPLGAPSTRLGRRQAQTARAVRRRLTWCGQQSCAAFERSRRVALEIMWWPPSSAASTLVREAAGPAYRRTVDLGGRLRGPVLAAVSGVGRRPLWGQAGPDHRAVTRGDPGVVRWRR